MQEEAAQTEVCGFIKLVLCEEGFRLWEPEIWVLRNVLRADSAEVAGTRKKSQLHDMCPAPNVVRRMGRAGREGTTQWFTFLRAFRKIAKSVYQFRHVSLSVRLSVRPSAWNNSDLSGWIFRKISYLCIFKKMCRENKIPLKSAQNSRHFTWRRL